MKRFKPNACFAFSGGGSDWDDPVYYEIVHYGEEWGIDRRGEWMSRESFYVWEDCVYTTTSFPTKNRLILEDGDEFVPRCRISLEEYMNLRKYICDTRERIVELILSNIQSVDVEPHIGECRCLIEYIDDNKHIFSYVIYRIATISDELCEDESQLEIETDSFYKNFYAGHSYDKVRKSYVIDERIYIEVVQLFEDMRLHLSTEIQHIVDSREAEFPYLDLQ